jgi:hypothetical protein
MFVLFHKRVCGPRANSLFDYMLRQVTQLTRNSKRRTARQAGLFSRFFNFSQRDILREFKNLTYGIGSSYNMVSRVVVDASSFPTCFCTLVDGEPPVG